MCVCFCSTHTSDCSATARAAGGVASVHRSLEEALAAGQGELVVCGSLHLVGDFYALSKREGHTQ